MASIATYKVIGITSRKIIEREHTGAPQPGWLASFADNRKVDFVARYYPSKKGWVLFDMRELRVLSLHTGKEVWDSKSIIRVPKVWPNEDAAVMYAMSQLGTVAAAI